MDNPDISDASKFLVPDVSEDSVDIYDDLDVGFNIDAGKTPQESMDLYEEIVTEEQRIKESSYAELKSRFESAQNQIKELRRRLEEMEIQNTKLNTENCSLKKNISALFRTAKQEVTRKDAEILRLNLGSVKGHKFYTNNLLDRNLTSSRPLTSSPPPPSTSHPPARENYPPKHSPQLSKIENNNCISRLTTSSTETRASKESSACHSKSLSILQNESNKHKSKHREEKYQSLRPSQSPSKVWRQKTGSDSNKDGSAPDKTRSHKVDNDSRRNYDSRTSFSKTYLNAEGHHKVDRAKSPCQEIFDSTLRTGRSRELRYDKAKLITESEHGSAYSSKEHHSRDSRNSYRCNSASNSKDQKRSSSNQKRYKVSTKDREGERFSKNYQKKAERRHEDEVRKYKRNSLSEASRECRRQSSKKLDKSDIHDSNKDKQKNKHGTPERSSNNKTTEKGSREGDSPNKKLCFMEILNLTLSPIKKSTVPMNVNQDEPSGDMVHHQSGDENSQPNVEDMCIIDEIGSGQSEDVAEPTSDIPAHIAKSCESVKDFQKDATNYNKSEVEKPLEDTSVKTTSAHEQSLDMGPNQITEDPTSNFQQSSFVKPQNRENRMELTSESQVESAPLEATGSINNTFRSISKRHTSSSSEQGCLVINADQPVAIIEPFVLKSREEKPLKTTIWTSFPVNAVEDGPNDSPSRQNPVTENVPGCFKSQCMPPAVLPQSCQQGLSALFRPVYKKALCDKQGDPKETEAVSSTISVESFPQAGLSLPEAIHILTEAIEDVGDSLTPKLCSSTSCTGVSKVSSTTEDLVVPKSHMSKCSELTFPQKNYSLAKSCESNVEPSSSMLVLHDEDSMMHTLNNLKRFPDAISPLRSPIQITKRSHLYNQVNPGVVKSLQTDFSDTAIEVNPKKLDVNKENKYTGSSADSDMHNMVDKATDHLSSLTDTDMEEGEILSESEESVPDYPVLTTELAMLSSPASNEPNHKTVVKRKPEDYILVSKETPGASTRSPKSRFKTVCPAATKVSFSNIDQIMETFKLVRREIRKKYMKLHKTFPKKSFYGMMDNFQKSFLEFVEGAQFGKICSQAEELKCRLKKLIATVFSKLTNNGIVKRIFEQQATDLKQKLWDFVDVQIEYLFKDIKTTLKNLCKPASTQAKDMRPNWNENMSTHPSVKKEFQSASHTPIQVKTSAVVPYRTGLGSRGKDIRITHVEKPTNLNLSPADIQKTQTRIDILPTKKIPPTPETNNLVSLIVAQNSSLNDKTDFNILTEQQASSLTFNLVRDSQMGEIFKCLLQGSDLLETSGITGDCTAWPLSTPRKDGERLISITTPTKFDSPSKFLSLNKFDTPSKLIATWSSISPLNMPSPRSRDPVTLNPALFDESCLLEVPSENSVPPQKSHYVLAEDLAVSLTIPSPLKSDSHLSFLQPPSMHRMSTPDSVISAHICEDALLDNEDITEQDIHLTLDTDNSSCGSISSMASVPCSTSFNFQPDKPMQALVMEKSNDHFIVKIRQAALADAPLGPDDSLSKTLGAEDMAQDTLKESQTEIAFYNCSSPSDSIPSVRCDLDEISGLCYAVTQEKCSIKDLLCQNEGTITHQSTSKISISEELQPLNDHPSHNILKADSQSSPSVCEQFSKITDKKGITLTTDEFETDGHHIGENTKTQKRSFKAVISASNNNPHLPAESCESKQRNKDSLTQSSDLAREDVKASECERNFVIAENMSSTPETEKSGGTKARKRKKHQEKSKAKRCRKEEERTETTVSTKDNNKSNSSSAPLSPNSLSARNVIRKKGEVVMAWTRDEDRAILIDLKKKGPSRETFSALSEKLKKPTGQIAHRFYQLMKLFKKQEKV